MKTTLPSNIFISAFVNLFLALYQPRATLRYGLSTSVGYPGMTQFSSLSNMHSGNGNMAGSMGLAQNQRYLPSMMVDYGLNLVSGWCYGLSSSPSKYASMSSFKAVQAFQKRASFFQISFKKLVRLRTPHHRRVRKTGTTKASTPYESTNTPLSTPPCYPTRPNLSRATSNPSNVLDCNYFLYKVYCVLRFCQNYNIFQFKNDIKSVSVV